MLDASGDFPGTSRSAFPKNTAAFRDRFGSEFTDMLIEEANLGRAIRGFGPKQWIYKGYGLFQYDLQFVLEDVDFFRERRWYDFDACLEKCLHELKEKRKRFPNDLWEAIRAYNGAGSRAIQYSKNVKQLRSGLPMKFPRWERQVCLWQSPFPRAKSLRLQCRQRRKTHCLLVAICLTQSPD
ncbi:MAG: hypothetical protein HC845_07840 [Akkermansiaceae bacterium]|nr:hypothetical protein [Akkermansiaceae bacterium]